MKLSILICSLKSRKHLLDRLLAHLEVQRNFLSNPGDVEILVECDSGEKTTGEKRNILLDRAVGDFIMYSDDDDLYSPNMCEVVLEALQSNPDAVGINLLMRWQNSGKTERSFHIGQFKDSEWFQTEDPLLPNHLNYWRGMNHINPVRRELALKTRFKEISMGEDRDYAYRLAPLIKTWVDIEQPIYFYLFNPHKTY